MIRKILRTAQNLFPGLGEAKNEFYHWSRKRFGLLHDPSFAAVARLPRRADDLFLDVGANRGQSILSLRRVRPDAAIVSFEPNPRMVRWLNARFGDDEGWLLVPYGLGASADRRTLFTPRYAGFAYDGLATFSEEAARAYLSSETLFGFDPTRLTLDREVCEIRTLDRLGLRPTFIKIDVEGLEHEVLQGGEATIRACEPVLMVERYHRNPDLLPLLDRLGYVEVRPAGTGFEHGGTRSENMFCMTPRTLAQIQDAATAPTTSPEIRLASA
jgi:FkbM family methyltransferase